MNIIYNNIGTPYEKFDIFLDVKDYKNLFESEIAFGKLLKIYIELSNVMMEDKERLLEWVESPLYEKTKENIEKLYNIIKRSDVTNE